VYSGEGDHRLRWKTEQRSPLTIFPIPATTINRSGCPLETALECSDIWYMVRRRRGLLFRVAIGKIMKLAAKIPAAMPVSEPQ
jgi:hypothetical protein